MEAFIVAPASFSHDKVQVTSNSVAEPPGAQESLIAGWAAGSLDETNTKTQ